jgi:hypothetical protein
MPTYSASGTEDLGSDPKTYDATTSGAYEKDEKAGSGGKDAGGDATNAKTLSGGSKPTPNGGGSTPRGVQSFDAEET